MHKKTQGLVLREIGIRETDKLLTVLTRDEGKLTVLARGAKRKGSRLVSASQLLVYSEMTLFEYKNRYSLDQADTIEVFDEVRSDVEMLSLASYFAELAELLSDEDCATPEILPLILNSMHALGKLHRSRDLVKAVFELRLMTLSGFEPLLDCCAVCGREPETPFLNVKQGVLHCGECAEEAGDGISMPLDKSSLAAMRHVAYGDPKRLFSFSLTGEAMKHFADAGEVFLLTQLERGFSTLDFYKKLISTKEMP